MEKKERHWTTIALHKDVCEELKSRGSAGDTPNTVVKELLKMTR